jgi:hypothetical protein
MGLHSFFLPLSKFSLSHFSTFAHFLHVISFSFKTWPTTKHKIPSLIEDRFGYT